MKKASFIKAACAGIFMTAVAGCQESPPAEGTCTSGEKHYAPGTTVSIKAERNSTGSAVIFTLGMGEFDDLFSRNGRTTAHFVTPPDKNGKRIVVIDGIPATATESIPDESVTVEMSSAAFDNLFAAETGVVVNRNGWTCTLPGINP